MLTTEDMKELSFYSKVPVSGGAERMNKAPGRGCFIYRCTLYNRNLSDCENPNP